MEVKPGFWDPQSTTKLAETLCLKVLPTIKACPPPSSPCNVVPLFLLPVENNEHANFEWRGGRGVWILLFSEIILQQFCRRLQKKCPFPLNKGVPSVKVTDIKITWLTFFQDQILCPLNGGIPWIEVPKRRYFTVLFIILFKFRSSLRKKKLLLWRHLVIQVCYTSCNSLYHNWVSYINTRKYCNLIGSYQ